MLPEEEVVDLTDSPGGMAGALGQQRQQGLPPTAMPDSPAARRHPPPPPAAANPPAPSPHADEAPDHRASGKRRRPEGAPIDLAADAEEEDGVEEAAAARARIMQHALRGNQPRGLASGGTAPPPAPQPQQHQPAGLAGGTDAAIEAPAPAAVGNSLLAQLHAERMARQSQRQQGQAQGPPSSNGHLEPQQQGQHQQQQHHRQAQGPPSGYDQPAPQQQGQGPGLPQGPAQLSLLSYNVWFQDVRIQRRMAAIGSIIQARQPDFVCLQVGRQGPCCQQ